MNHLYVNAKLHAQYSKGLLGVPTDLLLAIDTIESLYKAVFPADKEEHSENRKYEFLEKKLRESLTQRLIQLSSYVRSKDSPVYAFLLVFDIDNLKRVVRTFYAKKRKPDHLLKSQLKGVFNYQQIEGVNFSKIEEIRSVLIGELGRMTVKMLENNTSVFTVDVVLDQYHYRNLKGAIEKLDLDSRKRFLKVFEKEVLMNNVLWAVRLNRYYHKSFVDSQNSFVMLNKESEIKMIKNIMNFDFEELNPADHLNAGGEEVPLFLKELFEKSLDSRFILDTSLFEKNCKEFIYGEYSSFFYLKNAPSTSIAYIYLLRSEYDRLMSHISHIYYTE